MDGCQTWALTRQTVTGELGQVQTLMMDLQEETMPSERGHGIVTSQTATETGRVGMVIVTMEEEIDTEIDTMIGIAGIAMTTGETMIEEVTTLAVEEVAVPSAVAFAVTMTTVGAAGTVTETEIVTVVIAKTDMRDVRSGVRNGLLCKDPS